MKVQPYANVNTKRKACSINFKSNGRSKDYLAYMADHSDDNVTLSVFTGTVIGAIDSAKNLKKEFPFRALKHVGTMMILMFGLRSVEFFAKQKKHNNNSI